MSCAKTAEPIKVLFQVLTQMEPCGGPDPPVKGHFRGHLSAHCRLSIGNINLILQVAAAMWPFTVSSAATCSH